MKTEHIILAIVILAALVVRVYPATSYDTPLKYDSYYHVRIASLMEQQGPLITQEPWPEDGRPHFYPPLYHILLIIASTLTFQPLLSIARFVLPFFAALIPLTTFWFVRKSRGDYTALIAAFLMAFNAFFLDASYDSAEVFGFLLLPFIAYFVLKEDYLKAGLTLAAAMAFNIFFGAYSAAALLIFVIYKGKLGETYQKLFGPAVIFFVLWNLPRIGELAHTDFVLGSSLIAKTLGGWAMVYAPAIIAALLLVFGLMKYMPKIRYKPDKYVSFWTIWTLFFTAMFLTFVVTPAAYPWRMPTYISIGLSILMADLLSKASFKNKNVVKIAAAAVMILFIAVPAVAYLGSGNLRPALDSNEYRTISWINSTVPDGSLILSDSVFCSNIITISGKKCALDINFESIPDKQRWIDYTNFFETSQDVVSAKLFLEKYPQISYVVYANKYSGRKELDSIGDRIYASWECDNRTFTCFNSSAAYRVK